MRESDNKKQLRVLKRGGGVISGEETSNEGNRINIHGIHNINNDQKICTLFHPQKSCLLQSQEKMSEWEGEVEKTSIEFQ